MHTLLLGSQCDTVLPIPARYLMPSDDSALFLDSPRTPTSNERIQGSVACHPRYALAPLQAVPPSPISGPPDQAELDDGAVSICRTFQWEFPKHGPTPYALQVVPSFNCALPVCRAGSEVCFQNTCEADLCFLTTTKLAGI